MSKVKTNKKSKQKINQGGQARQSQAELSPEARAFLYGDGSSPNLRKSPAPFVMCMLAGTASIILAGKFWIHAIVVAVFFISLASIVYKVRHDKAYDIPLSKGDIIGGFLTSFLFYAFIAFSFALASLVLYQAVFAKV